VTTVLRNHGSIQNSGHEAVLTTTFFNGPRFGWDLTVAGSVNKNRIISLGKDTLLGTGTIRNKVGFPLQAYWFRPYTFADANNNNIIEATEVTVSPDFEYRGYSVPTRIVSFTNGIDLFDRRLRINAMIDHKGGHYISNSTRSFQCQQNAACEARSNPDVSLEEQAAYIAITRPVSTSVGYNEKGDFWRFRDLSATLSAPQRLASLARAQGMTLSLGAKNLAVWTKYKGADPEENYSTGDVQTTFASSAPRTYYTLRMNLTY
jgi:hypothetical protein